MVALEKPSEVERGQWYFQRYISTCPTAGEIVLFDRSWYNRAGVERVMGFCSGNEYREFMHQAPEFERHLVRSGIYAPVFGSPVSQKEAAPPLQERQVHPAQAVEAQPGGFGLAGQVGRLHPRQRSDVFETDTADSPWTVVKSDCKKRAPERHALRAAQAALRQQIARNHWQARHLIVGRANAAVRARRAPQRAGAWWPPRFFGGLPVRQWCAAGHVCCGCYLDHWDSQPAPDAERLMRSR